MSSLRYENLFGKERYIDLDQFRCGKHRLTSKECQILRFLLEHLEQVIPRERLFFVLYGQDEDGGPLGNAIAVHMCHLRIKLIGSGYRLVSLRNAGVLLEKLPSKDSSGVNSTHPGSESAA